MNCLNRVVNNFFVLVSQCHGYFILVIEVKRISGKWKLF